MAISKFYFNTDLLYRVWFNGNDLDYVFWNTVQVFQRTVAAGSVEITNVGHTEWIPPEGVSEVTFCVAGGGGGGGAGRGGGGGGAGALQEFVTGLGGEGQYVNVYIGSGGSGSQRWDQRGSWGGSTTLTGNYNFSAINATGGQGGLTDETALGSNGGGYGGDGLPPANGGNYSGCGGSFTGGLKGAGNTNTGGGGAGAFGNGGDGGGSTTKTLPTAPRTGGGGGVVNGLPYQTGWIGGRGGAGYCKISWVEH